MDIDKIINEVKEMHPYKKAGDRDSYSQYAEGWSDACDILGEHIKQYLCEGNQANSENANCAIFDVIAMLPTPDDMEVYKGHRSECFKGEYMFGLQTGIENCYEWIKDWIRAKAHG